MNDSVKTLKHTILNTFFLFFFFVSVWTSHVFFSGVVSNFAWNCYFSLKKKQNKSSLIYLRGFVLQICLLFHIENVVEKHGFQIIL